MMTMQMKTVIIDTSIAFQKLSSKYKMYNQKGAAILIKPAQKQ